MKEGWTYKKLGDVCNVLNGLWIGKKEPFVNVAVIRNTNFSKDCKLKLDDVAYIDVEERQFATRKLQVGDIIIEKSGGSDKQPVGRPVLFNIPDGDYSFSNFTSTLRLTDKSIFPPFLHYCLYGYYRNGETKKMQSKTTGLRNLDMKAYLRLAIPYFEIAEQERIVAELDLLQGIIEKKKEQLKAYDQLAQSIFYTMFGDPIDNPKGWEVKHLGEVCDFINGFAFKSDLFKNNGLPILRISNIQNNVVNEEGMVYFSPTDYREDFTKYSVNKGDIVIAMSGATTGKLGVYLGERTCYLNQRVGKFQVKSEDRITNKSLLYYLRTISKQILTDAMGVAQPNISSKQIKEYTIILPPLSLQQEFAEKVEAIERQKALVQRSIEETQTMFDYTMDKYFG